MPNKSAVEVLIFKPNPAIPSDQRGVHENLWIKQRFQQYVSIGVYLDGSDLKYYFFENCDNNPKIYTSLVELKQELPKSLENIFENTPKLFMMGHGHGGRYGLGNLHGPSEEIYNEDLDKIIADFEKALPAQHDEIFVTLEACNTDNQKLAAEEGQEKTFLERLSANPKHSRITFSGTGPWDPNDVETGYRSSGGFPTLNAPVTAVGGGIWKHDNSNRVIFFHGNYQVVVRKSMFASTKTAKELKINTIEYAREILKHTSLNSSAREEILIKICANRDILNIKDLNKASDFPQEKFEDEKIVRLLAEEKKILDKEKNSYITHVREILARAELDNKFSDRDLLIISLGLKDFSVSKNLSIFNGHENLCRKILNNKALLRLIMVTCGKALIAGPSNNSLIDLLLERGIGINSVDGKGMTALHYAVQNFYNYRKEPCGLINKLLYCGANLEAENHKKQTPLMLAIEHSRKETVIASEKLLRLLQGQRQRLAAASSSTIKPETPFHHTIRRRHSIAAMPDRDNSQSEISNAKILPRSGSFSK